VFFVPLWHIITERREAIMHDESEARDQRIPIMMTRAEVEAIDDWMFANRFRTRARAVRELVERGLKPGRQANTIVSDVEVYRTKSRTSIGFTSPNGLFSVQLSNELLAKLIAEASGENPA